MPDRHLHVEDRVMRVHVGARENRHRPPIDTLFRSLALAYRERALGVVLSGQLDDGVAGPMAIKAWGDTAIVQDPQEARAAQMPLHAVQRVPIDHCLPAHAIGPLLARRVRGTAERAVPRPAEPAPGQDHPLDPAAASAGGSGYGPEQRPSSYGCPTCGGVLWEVDDGFGWLRFRCRVGHAFSAHSLVDEQKQALQESLWSALRSLEKNANLMLRLAEAETEAPGADVLRQHAQTALTRAARLCELLPPA